MQAERLDQDREFNELHRSPLKEERLVFVVDGDSRRRPQAEYYMESKDIDGEDTHFASNKQISVLTPLALGCGSLTFN